ncbi:zinc metalloprotease [Streptomonospora litoralis]|uniref:Pregnancy-associated plasma protein-A n=1 Tax=Streptomonospora litoralis TaxID=2498135 RepID=A0A4P6PXN4_9ACTN|nr:zinc metalloprotease [Streptomonospora litoralis]QBI52895.1 Pregnancy-associated plasma protein-A [Streptomonospora litoralis]
MGGETGAALRLWGGLLMGAGALAGVVAASAAEADTTGAARAADDCPPESAQSRIEPRRDEHGHLTAEEAAAYDKELREALRAQQGPDAQESAAEITVPVAVHIIHAEDGTGDVSAETVNEQIAVLNKAFRGGYSGADTRFDFRLEDVTRTADDAWAADFSANESEIKSSLRQGGAETLNLYIAQLGDGILGQATFPQDYSAAPESDGVVVDRNTIPGGGLEGFDLGFTAVHESGHWLGLFHTFQNACTEPGDYVADTPYEAEQSSGCPEGRDTCPARSGDDPVHNFMDYSDDPCLNNFTEGQATRMSEHWTAFRSPEPEPTPTPTPTASPTASPTPTPTASPIPSASAPSPAA